jgi:PAS domain S-box-containing protein
VSSFLTSSNVAPVRPSALRFLILPVLGLALLVAMALWFGSETRDLNAVRGTVRASYENRIAATDLLRRLAEAETSQRGYVITGQDIFLQPFDAAHEDVDAGLDALDREFAQAPAQRARVARLRRLIVAKFAEMADVIDLRRNSGLSSAIARVSAGVGVQLMSEARGTVDDIVAAENRTLAAKLAVVQPRNLLIQRIAWALVIVIGVLLAFGTMLFWKARNARYQTERAAHEASLRLRAVFAGTIDAIIILDSVGRVEAVNAAASLMLGYPTDALVGAKGTDLLSVEEDGRSFAQIIGFIDGHLTRTTWFDRTIRRNDGQIVPIDIALGLVPLPDDMHFVASLRDISERKAAERLKDEFVATVSHELRTPLTSVVGSLGLLRAGSVGELPDAARRLVEIAENNSKRLIRLINDILDIEKIGSGRMQFESEPFGLEEVTRRALEGSTGLAEASGVRLELIVMAAPPIVDGDADKLLQVVTNLLSNAIRFSPPRGRVLVTIGREHGQALLQVEDEGPGVPAAFESRIFERFSQAGENHVQGGTGLGLAISHEIVKAHGGRIWFDRSAGGGARFSVALPPTAITPIEDDARHARILVCEDQPDIAEVLRRTLEAEGCVVDCVSTAHEAEQAARSGRYDGIVLDLVLPDASGLEAVRRLRNRIETRSIPVIVVSAFAHIGEDDPTAAALDVIDWIDKPVDQLRLVKAVRRAIERSASGRPTLLHIDDDIDMLEVTATALADQGRMLRATSLASARAALATKAPDIVILDLGLPDGSGLELLPELFTADGTAIPTIIYSAKEVMPDVRRQVDAVLVKSRRSLPSLSATIRHMLEFSGRPNEDL